MTPGRSPLHHDEELTQAIRRFGNPIVVYAVDRTADAADVEPGTSKWTDY